MISSQPSLVECLDRFLNGDPLRVKELADASGIRGSTILSWRTEPPLERNFLSIKGMNRLLPLLKYDYEHKLVADVAASCYVLWDSYGFTPEDFPRSFGISTVDEFCQFLKEVHNFNTRLIAVVARLSTQEFNSFGDWFRRRAYNPSQQLLERVFLLLPLIEWYSDNRCFFEQSAAHHLFMMFYEACEGTSITSTTSYNSRSKFATEGVRLNISVGVLEQNIKDVRKGKPISHFRDVPVYGAIVGYLRSDESYRHRYFSVTKGPTVEENLRRFQEWFLGFKRHAKQSISELPVLAPSPVAEPVLPVISVLTNTPPLLKSTIPVQTDCAVPHVPDFDLKSMCAALRSSDRAGLEAYTALLALESDDDLFELIYRHVYALTLGLKLLADRDYTDRNTRLAALSGAPTLDALIESLVNLGQKKHPSVRVYGLGTTVNLAFAPDYQGTGEHYRELKEKLTKNKGGASR